ncbi:MAG TPA: peptidoglycan DD-metalloendopeptidase family protein [Xanthomonadales bacterium]|nr:peptidoglycan DD-metalloendopeptidase family protein [Xanthomonadales bacterium]
MKAQIRTIQSALILLLALANVSASATNNGDESSSFVLLSSSSPLKMEAIPSPGDPGHELPARLEERIASRKKIQSDDSVTEGSGGSVMFDLPIRKGITNSNPGFYSISNFVDQDLMAPDMLLDYNCGERTYDLENGLNHNGIDYFNFPYSWLMMDQDGSVVVAAADGTIIEKHDGEDDMSCAFSESARANEIWLEHADGSATVYTHLKKNSTTAKQEGDTVEAGEYLGVVGSSGFSTGPHLHFGVYDSGNNLIEPYEGACNSLNDDSRWNEQPDYYETGITLIASHDAQPVVPDCPTIEEPNFQNEFSAGDTAYFSAFFRDALTGIIGSIEIRDPSGITVVNFGNFEWTQSDHAAGASVITGAVEFPSNAESGEYTLRVTYGSAVQEHKFYIDSSPPTPPGATVANNAQNGLFFDPGKDGEGYNFVTTASGTIIYFYGSDKFGNRLWLISDLIPGSFRPGSNIEVTMFESTGGTFGSPVPSARGLSVWGTLVVRFSDCDNAVATLNGVDGNKVSNLIKLAGVAGTDCTDGGVTADSPWSGLWFAIADEGEGYNLVVAPNGAILYFYGFKSDGRRLWLISDLVVDQLQVGASVAADMYEATQGDFENPVPSAQALVLWGSAIITLIDCSNMTIELIGSDGSKTSVTIRLAGVIGLECSE